MIATDNSRLFAKSSCFPRFFLVLKNTSALILFSLNKSTSHNNSLNIFDPLHKLKLVFDLLL